jgi:uncharacterized phage-associated protein
VVRSLWNELKPYGAGPITHRIKPNFASGDTVPILDEGSRQFLHRIWDVYGKMTGPQLSALTHEPDTPWSITRQRATGVRNSPIPNRLMVEYFRRLADQNAAARAVVGA